MITGHDLINEYYEDEKLYSTGDEDLDYLLERAFCDGYDYYQREFGIGDWVTKQERNRAARIIKSTHRNALNSGVNFGAKGDLGKENRNILDSLRDAAQGAKECLPKGKANFKDVRTNRSNLKLLGSSDTTKPFYSGKKPFRS